MLEGWRATGTRTITEEGAIVSVGNDQAASLTMPAPTVKHDPDRISCRGAQRRVQLLGDRHDQSARHQRGYRLSRIPQRHRRECLGLVNMAGGPALDASAMAVIPARNTS